MKPWEILGRTRTPDGTELTLAKHADEYVILADRQSLMSSRAHGTEDALAVLGCRRARTLARPHVLVGGLGMGFTLRAALDCLPPAATIVVSEIVPAIVDWNRGVLGALAGYPLDDPRVRLEQGDVGAALGANPSRFDAVLLDVDNGPAALTLASNAGLYGRSGIAAALAALSRDGVLAVWSAQDDRRFERRLREGGFRVVREHVRAHQAKGACHTVLVASRRGERPRLRPRPSSRSNI